MYWALYLRVANKPKTLKWCGYWSLHPLTKPTAYREEKTAHETIETLVLTLNDNETIELWENNEWHMPTRFLSAHAKVTP